MFPQWKPCPDLPPRLVHQPAYLKAPRGISNPLAKHATLPILPWPNMSHVSPLSSQLCWHMELQDDVLQSQHHLLRDEDTVVELVLRAELPQKGLRLRGTEP